ncbi:MAG TPA: thioredoxin [Atribacter sp.]|jgi:thioredoxin 1|uniref:Thioredoxin n=1 Tax=Candidatus Atribacter allofermentans TaxID=1852833 RepID=A0A1V5SXT2_9BACT|nr:thioredoxin [Atribacter sp.]MDD3714395.1 thioredoxin [Atribacterota bacterium]OQA59325.1 MAG: Thioredoxin [Candidatus Atribacteria bacterium ADurb.Bin276]HHT10808.1 thioredoxin [Candidatus Atribacteria bacterium]MDI9595688.1 thioredoxin [Atribacterota bacterium]HQK84337.1 thioredoxin [Atribacter sp.]
MADSVIELNKANFDVEVLQSTTPVLVDFWASWCMPCRMMAPVVEEIAHDMKDKIKVGKLNTDDSGEIAARYGISAIPTLIVFNGGKEVDRIIGYVAKKAIETKINNIL